MAEEVDVERRLRRVAELVDLSGELLARQHRRRQRTEAAGSRDGDGQGDAAGAGHRRLHDRQLDAEAIGELTVVGSHARTLRRDAVAWFGATTQAAIGRVIIVV